MLRQRDQIGTAKVQVFENEKHQAGGDYADHQTGFLFMSVVFPFFNQNTSCIIYSYGNQQNEDVFRNEPHIEEAAGGQQHEPAPFVWQQIEQQRDNREENQKFYRVEEHSFGFEFGRQRYDF